MEHELKMSLSEMTGLLREIADSENPGEPLRRMGIKMGELSEAYKSDEGRSRFAKWNPFARCLQRLMRVEYANPSGAFNAMFALLYLLDDMSGPDGTALTFLDGTSLRRLLIGIFLTARLREPDPDTLGLREWLPV
jgi:hypothetical protein